MERAVITGATGFLGRNLASLCLEKGMEVFAIVRPESRNLGNLPKHEHLHLVRAALADSETWTKAIGCADVFFHFAWGGVNRAEIDSPAVQAANIADSLACVEGAAKLGARAFFDAGSRVEYGTPDCVFQEDLPCQPVNEYGKAKLAFAKKAEPLCDKLGMKFLHLRFFSVYGPGDHPWSIISTLARELPKGEKVSLSACRHEWNFMYIRDAVEAVYALWLHAGENPSAIVNVAGDDTRVLREFTEQAKSLAGSGELEYGTFVQAKEGAPSIRPDISRLKAFTRGDWVEKTSFAEGFRRTMDSDTTQEV